MNSRPASSASLAAVTLLRQEWSHRSGALVIVMPLEQFMPNRPNLNVLGPYMRVCFRSISSSSSPFRRSKIRQRSYCVLWNFPLFVAATTPCKEWIEHGRTKRRASRETILDLASAWGGLDDDHRQSVCG